MNGRSVIPIRATSLEGDIGPGGGHPDANMGGPSAPVTPSEEGTGIPLLVLHYTPNREGELFV